MKWIEIEYAAPLYGSVEVQGSKNSSLALLTAACLADEPVHLKGVPNIYDFRVIQEITQDIGIQMTREDNGWVYIDSRDVQSAQLDIQKTSIYRASYYFVGALLAKQKKVIIGYPGGDNFVSRPIDQHIKGLKALGARFTFHEDHYVVEADGLKGNDIYFDMITSGATMNCMMAAVLAEGKTILRNAAKDPEVVDTANMLIQMGAKIAGAGTDTIRIEGVKQLGGCQYTIIPDRLIAGSLLIAAGVTGGRITVENIIPEHLESFIMKMTEIGMNIEEQENQLTAQVKDVLKATRVRTGMYPGFATDLQQPLTSLLLLSAGRSIITEAVYPKRFNHIHQLQRMGANIELRGSSSAIIHGQHPLKGTWVHATDVRAGTALILAGLAAEGKTFITGIEHIERGYEDVIQLFSSLGANIAMHEGELLQENDQVEVMSYNIENDG